MVWACTFDETLTGWAAEADHPEIALSTLQSAHHIWFQPGAAALPIRGSCRHFRHSSSF
jgi:hypothetical protein